MKSVKRNRELEGMQKNAAGGSRATHLSDISGKYFIMLLILMSLIQIHLSAATPEGTLSFLPTAPRGSRFHHHRAI